MPQELKQVNGRWVVAGAQRSSDLVPVAKPAGQQIKPQPAPSARRSQQQAKPWWARLGNDLQYEINQLKKDPLSSYKRALGSQFQAATGGQGSRDLALGVYGAQDNALRLGYSTLQRIQGRKKADPTAGQFGQHLDQSAEQVYRLLGATPPSRMNQYERQYDQARRSVAGNLALAPFSPGLGAATATTAAGGAIRGGAAFALNEILSTVFDDFTGGNPVNLINDMTGLKLPGAVNVGQDDMVDAAAKSIIPNALTSLAVGAGAGVAVSGFRNIRRNIRAQRAVQREVAQRAKQEAMGFLQKDEADAFGFTPQARQPVETPAAPAPEPTFQEANAAMEERLGMRPPAVEPAPTATPEVAAPGPRPIPTIENATTENFGGARDATTQPLPEADPSIDYWTYDPDLPESTALGKTLEDLSDQELMTVVSNPGLPVVERVNQVIEARAAVEPRLPVSAEMVMAPADRLADDYLETVTRKLGGREDYELRPLFDPEVNPQLWQRAQALTGVDDPSQLSKADMLDTFGAMAADGQAPIVNRMMGGQMLPTGEVQAAPQVFQYKGGVNEAGEQIGNSLEGVVRWDPNAENIIQVWRDANGEIGQPGAVYVVNGHNRLAAAKRLGIPSMRVEYLDSPTAGEARLQGAISNVSDGKGTVFDAAKLAREYGITDQAQLKAMGKPRNSGFWKEGIALGRLPEDVFAAAVNGQLGETTRKAVIIGESGANEETMRSAYRYLVQQGPDNVREGLLREMLAMAGHSPAASSSDGVQGTILDGTEWGQQFNAGMLAKADLASSVRLLLSREKKLFGTVGRQSGQIERVGQVDAGAAKEISGEASRALAIFDELKYQTGPVGELLNEGTTRVLAGEEPAAVAKGIKNRLAAAINEAMGKEVAPATDVVQEDMFAAAARAANEPQAPIELTPEQRMAAEAQALHQGIAGGELRPPSAPLPELPEPARVRLDEAQAELAAGGLQPGSKAAQAAADEVRLAIEHKQADAAFAWDQEQALRDANGHENLTFDQKKDAGTGEVFTPEVMSPDSQQPRVADIFRDLMRSMAESDARLFREIDGLTKVTRKSINELSGLAGAPVRPEPLRITAGAQQPQFTLPQELSKSAPRYGRYTVKFESDLDRAAYVLANDAVKPSKAAAKFRASIEAAGMDAAEVVAHGKRVKAALKKAAQGNSAGQVELPAQPWAGQLPDLEMAYEWTSKPNDPDFVKAENERILRRERQDLALEIIRKVAGPDVAVRFEDQYLVGIRKAEWGGDGKKKALKGGFYRLEEDLIMIRGILRGRSSDTAEASFHESFHRLQYLALGEKEAKVLDSFWARMKIAIGSNHVEGIDGLPVAYSESQAVAFQRYAEARRTGKNPVIAMLGGFSPERPLIEKLAARVISGFDNVIDFAEKLYNRLALGTFDSTKAVFERARRGALVEQSDYAYEEVGSGMDMMLSAGGWRRKSWDLREIPTKAGADRVRQQIEVNNQTMDDIRRKAQQEGC